MHAQHPHALMNQQPGSTKDAAGQIGNLGQLSPDSSLKDASAASGISLNVSLGSSKSQSNQSSSSNTAKGSSLTAGGNITIKASGADKDSDITIQGSSVQAAGTTRLSAQGDVNLLAAATTSAEANSTSSKSGSIGVSLSAAGLSANASASKSKGSGQGNNTSYTNTQVSGQTVEIDSGGDTTIKGAVVQGNQVSAKVGGKLSIESLQDTSQYSESSKSSGFSVSVPIASGNFGASASKGKSNINSNFASVTEQSGIKAGDGGFQIDVKDKTNLKGAVITSTQKAQEDGKNTFATAGQSAQEALQSGNLTITDIQNSASYSAKASNISIGLSKGKDGSTDESKGSQSPSSNSIGFGSDKGSASSITSAGISGLAGNQAARTGDVQTGIKPIFDKDQVKQDVNAQVQITQTALPRIAKAIGDEMQAKREALRQDAKKAAAAGDTAKASQLEAEAKKYDEGGFIHGATHTALGALAGGLAGALGAAASSAAAPLLQDVQDKMQESLIASGMSPADAKAAAGLVTGAAAAGLGAVASGGSTAGAATGFNADMNNRQLHPSERVLARQLAAKSGGKYTAAQIEEQMRLMGNQHIGQQANTPDVATTPEQNAQRIQNDPSMPIAVQGNVAVEVPGAYNADIQRFIQASTTNAGYIPGQSPYVGSNAQAGANGNNSSAQGAAPTAPKTASCGNSDLDCKSGVGVNQSQPVLTSEEKQALRQGLADTAGTISRGSGIIGSAATAAASVPGPHQPAAAATAVSATGVGFAADIVEQVARPDVGSGLNSFMSAILQEQLDKKVPFSAPLTNEALQYWKSSGSSQDFEAWINQEWKSFLKNRGDQK